jgi:TetR/AcrR family transcriptional repressor of nem operon
MRVSKAKAAENRKRILEEASRLIRERGISGTGVDALTAAAGLTHGSLYSQFGSKQELVEQALGHALQASGKVTASAASRDQFIARYLSRKHRDRLGHGCPLAALACEMPRQGPAVRATFTIGLRDFRDRLIGTMAAGGGRQQQEAQALATLASLIGALVLARAVDDPALSDAILQATRKKLDT